MNTPNKRPWKWVSATGGWDGIADADGHVLFKMSENNPINAEYAVQAVNNYAELLEALKLATNELNTIRARDGAPQHIDWDRGRPLQTDGCTKEWWDELTEKCFAAIAKAEGK